MFAATPPVEAQKFVFSIAVTDSIGFKRGEREKGLKFAFIDVERAYFYAKANADIFIRLPEEDREPGMCG